MQEQEKAASQGLLRTPLDGEEELLDLTTDSEGPRQQRTLTSLVERSASSRCSITASSRNHVVHPYIQTDEPALRTTSLTETVVRTGARKYRDRQSKHL